MGNRQFVEVRFNPWDKQAYTYHNDGEPVRIGDEVFVPMRGGKGRAKAVKVEAILNSPPRGFKTIGLVDAPPPVAVQASLFEES